MSNNFQFHYSQGKSFEGIIRNLTSKGSIWNYVDIYGTVSPSNSKLIPQHVFEFDNDEYWIGDYNEESVSLTFCFKDLFINVAGFQMQTSINGTARPKKFSFSSSLDNHSYELNPPTYEYPFEKGDVAFFSYLRKPAKCFKLTCIESVSKGNNFDVNKLELYGEMHLFLNNSKTCYQRMNIRFFSIFTTIYILS